MADRIAPEVEALWEEFHQTVNMSSQELRTWLLTDASGEEAFTADPDLHLPDLGREVVKILGKRKVDLTGEDAATMRRVIDLVADRLNSPPSQGVENDEWRHSLMTVGHDPFKPGEEPPHPE